ncbi:MAG: hypothetical protein AAGC49_12540 [Brevundimonas sp.]
MPHPRRYRLASTWLVEAPVERCWAVLADPTMSWPRWWPGVRARDVRPHAELVGSTAHVEFRARIPHVPGAYTLRLDLAVAGAEPPRRVTLRTTGDLEGSAFVELARASSPDSTRITVDWDVQTTLAWMNVLGPVLARPFAASHAAVMRAGEQGLRQLLADS